jgi:serine/threonine protein kinase
LIPNRYEWIKEKACNNLLNDAQIADFGLAREVISETRFNILSSSKLDLTFALVSSDGFSSGYLRTWQWLAPEVIDPEKNEYDERADLYSYGMVCYEILTRGTPFDEVQPAPPSPSPPRAARLSAR